MQLCLFVVRTRLWPQTNKSITVKAWRRWIWGSRVWKSVQQIFLLTRVIQYVLCNTGLWISLNFVTLFCSRNIYDE